MIVANGMPSLDGEKSDCLRKPRYACGDEPERIEGVCAKSIVRFLLNAHKARTGVAIDLTPAQMARYCLL
jgi:hypothetical protein